MSSQKKFVTLFNSHSLVISTLILVGKLAIYGLLGKMEFYSFSL